MAIKYVNIFQSKALQNLPNWDFWFEKETIWQPWRIATKVLLVQRSIFHSNVFARLPSFFIPNERVNAYETVKRRGQGCQIFLVQYTKMGRNMPNNHQMYQRAVNFSEWQESLQALCLPKCNHIGIFGMQINVASGNPGCAGEHKCFGSATQILQKLGSRCGSAVKW
jgi:hypothetical protein